MQRYFEQLGYLRLRLRLRLRQRDGAMLGRIADDLTGDVEPLTMRTFRRDRIDMERVADYVSPMSIQGTQ